MKIDRSFVTGMTKDGRHQAIVRSVVTLARSLGITVVAEGVERVEEADALRHLGADRAQGHLFFRAMPVEELAACLADDRYLP